MINNRVGWYRFSLVISVVFFVFLFAITWIILPNTNEIYKEWYNQLRICNEKQNLPKYFQIYNKDYFIYAVESEDYPKLVSVLENNINVQSKYFKEQCKLSNKAVCHNVFDQFDCPYNYSDINPKYEQMLKVEYSKQKVRIFFAIVLYCTYLFLLLSIWWICLGFVTKD